MDGGPVSTPDATQGNSNGEVNSPKIVCEDRFVGYTCDQDYPNKENALKHIANDHGPVHAITTMEDDKDMTDMTDMTGDK